LVSSPARGPAENFSDVNRTAGHIGPVLHQLIDEFPPAALAVEGIADDAWVGQTGSDHLFGFPVMLDPFKSLDRFLAHLPDPLVRAFGQLGVVLVLPTSRSFAECVALLASPEFPLHELNDKSGALLVAGNHNGTHHTRPKFPSARVVAVTGCFSVSFGKQAPWLPQLFALCYK
jgi:hypothetical protein